MAEYDVFLSHSSTDEQAVEEIAGRLRTEFELRPYFKRWMLVPGELWLPAIEKAIDTSTTIAVFLGPGQMGVWQEDEAARAIELVVRAEQRGRRVIPVLLPGTKLEDARGFLGLRTWVDLGAEDGMQRLVAAISGISLRQQELIAKPSRQGYTRVAVAQLDYQPAALINRQSQLTEPLFDLGKPSALEPGTGDVPPELTEPLRELRERIRSAYVVQLWGKLREIVATCVDWRVQILVLPEYSVPHELLQPLAAAAESMVIVAGTHTVERSALKAGVYESLEWSDRPRRGSAVVPVLHRGKLLALQPKLSAARLERGLATGDTWKPIEFESTAGPPLPDPMGVLICLDFLYRERELHRSLIGEQLERTRFLAVPSLTPWYTVDEFGAKGWEEARRYGRPVLYANHASGGGTTIFADEDKRRDLARFPERVGMLEAGEEGLIVADVDLGYQRTGSSTRYDSPRVVIPFAAASLVYRNHPVSAEYADWTTETSRRLREDSVSLDDELDRVEEHESKLLEAGSLFGNETRRRRVQRLLRELEGVGSSEELSRFTREIVLPAHVLPMSIVRQALALGASDAMFDWRKEHRSADYQKVGEVLRASAKQLLDTDPSQWTPNGTAVCDQLRRDVHAAVAPEPAPEPQRIETRPGFPVGVRIPNHDAPEKDGLTLMFRDGPSGLLHKDRSKGEQEGSQDHHAYPPRTDRVLHANWSPSQLKVATDLWLARRAAGFADATVVGIIGEDGSAIATLRCEDGMWLANAPDWGIGAAWLRTNFRAVESALRSMLGSFGGFEFVDEEIHLRARDEHLDRLRASARYEIARAVAQRVNIGFVPPTVESEGMRSTGFTALGQWLAGPKSAALVLGPFGTGKSTLLAKWAESQLGDDAGRVPVLVDLARANLTDPLGMLCEAARLDPTQESERAVMSWLVGRGHVIACFDGFDEMATRRAFADLPRELESLLRVGGQRGKVVVSSRDHYFSDERQVEQVTESASQRAGVSGLVRMDLQPFTEREIKLLVGQTFQDVDRRAEVLAKIRDTYDLLDLVQTPLLLHMVLETIDEIDPSARVGQARIYEEYLQRWLTNAEHGAKELFSRENKIAFAEVLAATLWRSGESSVAWKDLHRSVMARLVAEFPEITAGVPAEAAYLEIQGGSFFVWEGGDRFRFAHKSFLEYFVARGLLSGLEADPGRVLDTKPISIEVSSFVAQMVQDTGRDHPAISSLRQWLVGGRGRAGMAETSTAAANAVRLLRDVPRALGEAAGWIPDRADLQGISLAGESFEGMVLRHVKLDQANLAAVDFTRVNLEGASLRAAVLTGATFWQSVLEGADLDGARLDGAQGHQCQLRGAALQGASFRQSVWTACDWPLAISVPQELVQLADGTIVQIEEGLRPSFSSARYTFRAGHSDWVWSVAWAPDGQRLASASDDGSIRVWSADDGALLATLEGHSGSVLSVAWAPDGQRLASA
ncbi:MAG: TIR domain-containing protein, partial [Myxococcota bacterium]